MKQHRLHAMHNSSIKPQMLFKLNSKRAVQYLIAASFIVQLKEMYFESRHHSMILTFFRFDAKTKA